MTAVQKHHGKNSSVYSLEVCEGSHDFTIHIYSMCKGLGVGEVISSTEFHVGGCSWRIDFYPGGISSEFSDCISLVLSLTAGDPEKVSFHLVLVDQSPEKKHKVAEQRQPVIFRTSRSIGVIRNSITLPPSNIILHFRHILESGIGADVEFDVGGEMFSAHKIVLTARSSVFNAQFFGLLKDECLNPIKIEEMEACVFKALLHFIYCDDLPALNEFTEFDSVWNETSMYQHLIVAADRYDLDQLKSLCAIGISENMSINNVTSVWALAMRHNCPPLKSSVGEFVASLENLQALFETDDFKHLKESDYHLLSNFYCVVLVPNADLTHCEESKSIRSNT